MHLLTLAVAAILAALAPLPVPRPVLDGVEWAESRGDPFAVSRDWRCLGAFQLCTRWSALPAPLAFVPPLARREAARQIAAWQRRAGGRLAPALAAYRCGRGGLRGKCGQAYAAAILARAP